MPFLPLHIPMIQTCTTLSGESPPCVPGAPVWHASMLDKASAAWQGEGA